jgi:SAM-dependent methyltransferase
MDLGVQEVINLGTKEPLNAPLVLTRCEKCSLVQLRHTVNRDYLFKQGYWYRSNATKTMMKHLAEIVLDVENRISLDIDDVVVDIGSNDGTLLHFYPKWTRKVGFEPANIAPAFPPDDNQTTIMDFFSAGSYFAFKDRKPAKVISCVACFYDLDDPNAFLQDVKKVLAPDGLFVLQVNYWPSTLENNAIGDICHEHLCFYTLKTLTYMLIKNGLGLEDVSFNEINGGSVRLFIRPWLFPVNPPSVVNALLDEINLTVEPFIKGVSEAAFKVKAFVGAAVKSGKKVDVIGASTRGATFLQYADMIQYLRWCIERDASKVGKTYLRLPVMSEDAAFMTPPDFKLVSPTWFLAEIQEREKEFLKQGGLIVPLPVPMVITREGVKPL